MKKVLFLFLVLILLGSCTHVGGPQDEIDRLLAFADKDNDQKITVDDFPKGADSVSYLFTPPGETRPVELRGVFRFSNLLQELTLQKRGAGFRLEHVFEKPSQRISRSIRERYWDGLTRRFDDESLARLLPDSKIDKGEFRYLYVPSGDVDSIAYYRKLSDARPELKMKVTVLQEPVTDVEIEKIPANQHGLLALAKGVPFVVPGGRFNEMYGWDSYFESLGLISDGRIDLARGMVDQFVYEIQHYGKILNANRSYYLNRSQPPFLTAMANAVAAKLQDGPEKTAWLNRAMEAAIREYEQVWMSRDRLTTTGLSRYAGSGHKIPPEVERGAFDFVLRPVALQHRISIEELKKRYNERTIKSATLDDFFTQDRAVRESGHDTTYRWRVGPVDRASDFNTVDLNSVLYRYEIDIAKWFERERRDPEAAKTWWKRADRRRQLMVKYLWDPTREMFLDYDFKKGRRSSYVSATAFFPFWAEDPENDRSRFLEAKIARKSLLRLIRELGAAGGLAATSQASLESVKDRPVARQWDFPNGWAPHQMIAWAALANHGLRNEMRQLAFQWIEMITLNATRYNGTIPEKFDVVKRSHAVFAEYGNVGTQFSYIIEEGFGWVNASCQVGLALLSAEDRARLDKSAEEGL